MIVHPHAITYALRGVIIIICGILLRATDAASEESEMNTEDTPTSSSAGDWTSLYERHQFQQMPYRLLRPINLVEQSRTIYPLIVCLHGMGGRGEDNERQMKPWTQILADEKLRRKHPAFVVAPQTKSIWASNEAKPAITKEMIAQWPEAWRNTYKSGRQPWLFDYKGDLETLFALIDELTATLPIDPSRIYILGHSMGGLGVWNALCADPDRFAAAISAAGGLAPWLDPKQAVDVPIWSFHGIADKTIPIDFTEYAFERMKKSHGIMKLTRLKGVSHDANEAAFSYEGDQTDKGFVTEYSSDRCDRTPDVWDWLFAQKKAIEKVEEDQ